MRPTVDDKLCMLAPIIGNQKAEKLRLMYAHEDFFGRKDIEQYIDCLIAKKVKKTVQQEIILPPPDQSQADGDIYIGDIEYAGKQLFPLHVKLKDLNRHCLISGSTGSGKTTLALNLIRQLHKKNIPMLIIDWETSYRSLVKEFKESPFQVFTVGKDIKPLHINPLNIPPGISQEEYTKSLLAIIAVDYLSGVGSDTILMQFINQVYQEKQNPTFTDLKELALAAVNKEISKKGRLAGRSGLWTESALRVIRFVNTGATGNVLNTNKHLPLETLFGKNIVLEFGGVKNPHDRKFLIHVILNFLSLYLHHRGIEHDNLKQALFLEEFHNLCIRSKEDNFVSSMFRESRKYGLSLIALDQVPYAVDHISMANTNIKISFALKTQHDIYGMAKAMNLNQDQAKYLGMLSTGQAVANIGQSIKEPFLLRIPFTRSPDNVTDEELRQIQRDSPDLHVICAPEPKQSNFQPAQKTDTIPPTGSDQHLTGMEKVIIVDICNHPFDGIDSRRKRLNLHPGEIKTITDNLISRSVIKPVLIDNLKLFELLESGKKKASELGLKIPRTKGRGGIEHAYVVRQIRDHLIRIGLTPQEEYKDMDIVVREPETLITCEIETGKSNIYANLRKLIASEFKLKLLLSTRKETEYQLKMVAGTLPEIKVMFYKDFIKSYPTAAHFHPTKA